jgi:hypothetical protein
VNIAFVFDLSDPPQSPEIIWERTNRGVAAGLRDVE